MTPTMNPHIADTTYPLSLAMCFVLIAFIFYALGVHCQRLEVSRAPPTLEEAANAETSLSSKADYDRGFQDGMATSFRLKVHDELKLARSNSKSMMSQDKYVQARLAEMDKHEKERQRVFKENLHEMKRRREEDMRAIWDEKQVKEKGILKWFRRVVPNVNPGTKVAEKEVPVTAQVAYVAESWNEKKGR